MDIPPNLYLDGDYNDIFMTPIHQITLDLNEIIRGFDTNTIIMYEQNDDAAEINKWHEQRLKAYRTAIPDRIDNKGIYLVKTLDRRLQISWIYPPTVYQYSESIIAKIMERLTRMYSTSFETPWHLVDHSNASVQLFVYYMAELLTILLGIGTTTAYAYTPLLVECGINDIDLRKNFPDINLIILKGLIGACQLYRIKTDEDIYTRIKNHTNFTDLLQDPFFEAMQVGLFMES